MHELWMKRVKVWLINFRVQFFNCREQHDWLNFSTETIWRLLIVIRFDVLVANIGLHLHKTVQLFCCFLLWNNHFKSNLRIHTVGIMPSIRKKVYNVSNESFFLHSYSNVNICFQRNSIRATQHSLRLV